MRSSEAGFTTLELLVAASVGLVVTGSALAFLSMGNHLVSASLAQREAWRHVLAAASLWSVEWRGAGYDPTGTAGASLLRLAPDTMEFSADWNADGALEPTSRNPNERLAWAVGGGAWKRGVNGGPRLPLARPETLHFVFRDGLGEDLGSAPAVERARIAEAHLRVAGVAGGGIDLAWTATRRNP